MVNSVLDSITKALHDQFGDGYRYYVEEVEQKVKTPCFTIGVLNPITRSVNRKDYRRTMPCVIHYYTDNKANAIKTSYSIGEQVLERLEYLDINGHLVRGEDMSYMMVDDVLQVFITYRFWTERPETNTNMEDFSGVKTSVGNY